MAQFFPEIQNSGFNFSNGWFQGFKQRYGIIRRVKHGEADSVDPEVVLKSREYMKKITNHYSQRDIYNMDETGLFYRLQPNKTLSSVPVSGKKVVKDR